MPVVVHERFGRILAGVQDVLRSVCEGRARVPASGPNLVCCPRGPRASLRDHAGSSIGVLVT